MATDVELELLEAKANVEASDNDGRKPSLGVRRLQKRRMVTGSMWFHRLSNDSVRGS